MTKVSILVPAYNEQATIVELLEKVAQQKIESVEFEVIVIDDGSKDRTVELLKARPELYTKLIKQSKNGGKGAAVKIGMKEATGDYILFQDADLEYDPADYSKLMLPVLRFDADVVMGSRFLAPEFVRVSYFWHKVGNLLITFVFNIFNNTTFTDVYSCYLMFRRPFVDADHLKTEGWEQHAEILSKAIGAGKSIYVFAAIALSVSLVNVVNYMSLVAGGTNFAEIRSVTPPLLAFCVMYLVFQSIETTGRNKLLVVLVIVLAIAGLLFVREGKNPILVIIAGLLFWFRLKNLSVKHLILLGLVFVFTATILLQLTQMVRNPHLLALSDSGTQMAAKFRNLVHAKLVWRQLETRYCFHNIIDKHWDQPVSVARQGFWLRGLVPRVIWPNKPDMSLGVYYASEYCGVKNSPDAVLQHSASVTLLGQPLIQGGWIGLLLHGGFLIAALGGLAWLSRDPARLATVSVVALLPWLIDFDQDFALYVANSVKFFLAMLPLVVLAAIMNRPPSSA